MQYPEINILLGAFVMILTSIITATSTLLGVRMANNFNAKRLLVQLDHECNIKHEELMREKLEELYIGTEKWVNKLVITITAVLNGTDLVS